MKEKICDGSLEEIERLSKRPLGEPHFECYLSEIIEGIKEVDPNLSKARALAEKYIGAPK